VTATHWMGTDWVLGRPARSEGNIKGRRHMPLRDARLSPPSRTPPSIRSISWFLLLKNRIFVRHYPTLWNTLFPWAKKLGRGAAFRPTCRFQRTRSTCSRAHSRKGASRAQRTQVRAVGQIPCRNEISPLHVHVIPNLISTQLR